MKSFKEYAKQTPEPPVHTATQNAEQSPKNSQTEQTTATAAELANRLARSYNGKSNAAMLQSILAEAEKSKRAGTLSNAEIDAFYQSFAPMLDGVQKRKLRAVVERLKQI